MRFAISMDYAGAEGVGLTDELEQTADAIVTSLELEK
jgi:hypothetical protein